MKLLVITQAIDLDDPTLSVYHRWVEELASRTDVRVVCLKLGRNTLPAHVPVFSLGKEKGEATAFTYAFRFVRHIVQNRSEYDAVFVHMNQEYVLLGGLLWKLWGKRVYLWRNHHAGNILTDTAALFATKIFCTSKYSYTAKYRKTVRMPVGVDVDQFAPDNEVLRAKQSVLFLGRLDASKRPEVFLEALGLLKKKGVSFSADIVGSPTDPQSRFLQHLRDLSRERGLSAHVAFHPGVPNREVLAQYRHHEVYVNCSSSGMYDKTIFEAMASGCLILASNRNLQGSVHPRFLFKEEDVTDLAEKLEALFSLSLEEKRRYQKELRDFVVEHHGLRTLGMRLMEEMRP